MDQVNTSQSRMNNDAWNELQAFKTRQLNRKEKLNRHKRTYDDALNSNDNTANNFGSRLFGLKSSLQDLNDKLTLNLKASNYLDDSKSEVHASKLPDEKRSSTIDPIFDIDSVECLLLLKLCDVALKLPVDSRSLFRTLNRIKGLENLTQYTIENLLQKFAHQELINIEEPTIRPSNSSSVEETCIFVISADQTKLVEFDKSLGSLVYLRALLAETYQPKNDLYLDDIDSSANWNSKDDSTNQLNKLSDKSDKSISAIKPSSQPARNGNHTNAQDYKTDDVESLLSLYSTKEKKSKILGEELLELLSKPTAKERNLLERFRSADGYRVQEFCPKGTKDECCRTNKKEEACNKLHFKKIIARHTEESLGDCSFLNTCFHLDSCKYVHYEVDYDGYDNFKRPYEIERKISKESDSDGITDSHESKLNNRVIDQVKNVRPCYDLHRFESKKRYKTIICPPQWIQCDLRYFDMSLLGKFSVVMADPPWDIHMELPYGTMSDDEMRKLNIPTIQDEGVIFLWVTGRAMELGRDCLSIWGYERIDEIIWVKTNQLQRIIRTGRTGHWLNHGKEHCLVGIKGNPKNFNRGLDCDVIVAEVRATSHKPDEIYGIIERLSPGTRKIELFARQHNIQPNWVSVGNQLAGIQVVEPRLMKIFNQL